MSSTTTIWHTAGHSSCLPCPPELHGGLRDAEQSAPGSDFPPTGGFQRPTDTHGPGNRKWGRPTLGPCVFSWARVPNAVTVCRSPQGCREDADPTPWPVQWYRDKALGGQQAPGEAATFAGTLSIRCHLLHTSLSLGIESVGMGQTSGIPALCWEKGTSLGVNCAQ
jgi:hypothetical protein